MKNSNAGNTTQEKSTQKQLSQIESEAACKYLTILHQMKKTLSISDVNAKMRKEKWVYGGVI